MPNATFEMNAFRKNKILTGKEEIAEKIYYILNGKDSNFPNFTGLPKLYDNFIKSYTNKSQIESEITQALRSFLDTSIVIDAVVFDEDSKIIAVFFNNLDDPALFSIDETGLNKLNQ